MQPAVCIDSRAVHASTEHLCRSPARPSIETTLQNPFSFDRRPQAAIESCHFDQLRPDIHNDGPPRLGGH